MTTSRKQQQVEEVRWLIEHRPADVRAVVRGFKKLTRGRRREFGQGALYLVSLLEIGLRQMAKEKRAKMLKSRKTRRKAP